ncbi:MAG TPA: hypothetical protein VEZ70_06210 [Allosphingosinicella sp.]|nr:hypothetical protein [Allosphingosinicella sp.]
MTIRQRWLALGRVPAVRTALFLLGCLLIALTPVVAILPGPGGIFVFGAGAGLVLKYSEWAKRKYVEFKRRHPNKGAWCDWGLRRGSAKRRKARQEARIATGGERQCD